MTNPIFWLGLSFLLVAFSLTVFLVAALPAFQEIARAARSIEKLVDTLRRELPPTLEAIRLTGMEISDLTDDVSDGVKSAGQIVKQVDQSLDGAKKQAQKAQVTTKSVFVGIKAAWSSLTRSPSTRPKSERLSPSQRRMRSSRLQQASFDENRVEPLVYRDRYLEDSRQLSSDNPHFQPEPEDFERED
ncbi:MAG: DUF948 domain-containing protein [Chroococcidiopsidaceae cyanobacterium CP_BM_ER_R8_30]|nr:DUF948 domain-containing protein [Chroococcidiopsidaceae cyanobacterium CP_BM_ER_R8_30]